MITLINPPAIKSLSGLQMYAPDPTLRPAYIAAAIKDAGLPYRVIDGTGEVLDVVRMYPDRDNFMLQGPSFDEITPRVHPDAEDTRYAKWFVDRFYTRSRWRKLAETAHR